MQKSAWDKLKAVLVSIFVGACVAFLTSLMDGFIQALQGDGNNICAAVASMGAYLRSSRNA